MRALARLNGPQVTVIGLVLASFVATLALLAYLLLHLPESALERVLSDNFLAALAAVITALAGLAGAVFGMARRHGLLHPDHGDVGRNSKS